MVLSTVARANTAFATAGALSTTALATAALVVLPTTTFATPQPFPSPLAAVASSDINRLLEHVTAWGLSEGRLKRGDRILLVAGIGFGTGGHNMALVHEV